VRATDRPLDDVEKHWLLALARGAIRDELDGHRRQCSPPSTGPLTEIRGAFVTLMQGDRLRGCIGHVIASEPLWQSVRSNALNAAFRDPRFPPVEAAELAGLILEISALSPLRRLEAPDGIVVGRDGLLIESGHYRGLLLPQVAQRYGWTPEEFLDQTCLKAGVRRGAWRDPETTVSVFTAEVFGEGDVR
jgi:AmmeMemoRadiSam system protein A